jgi:hypothetical protein
MGRMSGLFKDCILFLTAKLRMCSKDQLLRRLRGKLLGWQSQRKVSGGIGMNFVHVRRRRDYTNAHLTKSLVICPCDQILWSDLIDGFTARLIKQTW